jgi:hypothetical protein
LFQEGEVGLKKFHMRMIIIIDKCIKYYIVGHRFGFSIRPIEKTVMFCPDRVISVRAKKYQVISHMKNSVKENMFFLWVRRVAQFYLDGFRSMTVGKTLWVVILIKLFVMFAVLKVFFFSDYLQANFSTDQQRSEHVLEQITLQAKITTGKQ